MNRDFAEMLKALAAESVEFLVVGAYAVAGHGIPRATGDIDLWVRSTPDNAARLWRALERFGAPRSRVSPESFTQPDVVYQIGLPPIRCQDARSCRTALMASQDQGKVIVWLSIAHTVRGIAGRADPDRRDPCQAER